MEAAMTYRVGVKPELLRWARERADADINFLIRKFPKYLEWESGNVQPTYKQLERYAKTVHAGVGFFFLSEPPKERFPIPDFRSTDGEPIRRPSVDLLDTVYLCQRRQDWYREFAIIEGDDPLPFINSAKLGEDVEAVAARIRSALGFDLEERRTCPTWTQAFRMFIEKSDALGVLVLVSGVVKNNTHRRLDSREFRGFAMPDDLAPLIFVNGADSKAAQMFTLAHEIAHLWLGATALSNSQPDTFTEHEVEFWCNRVAAELLVPLNVLRAEYRPGAKLHEELTRLAHRFKVSSLVVLRRIYDVNGLTLDEFHHAYLQEVERLKERPAKNGGSFHPAQSARLGKRFARALVADTLEGRTMFRDALRLLGFSKMETFHNLARNLGVEKGLSS